MKFFAKHGLITKRDKTTFCLIETREFSFWLKGELGHGLEEEREKKGRRKGEERRRREKGREKLKRKALKL